MGVLLSAGEVCKDGSAGLLEAGADRVGSDAELLGDLGRGVVTEPPGHDLALPGWERAERLQDDLTRLPLCGLFGAGQERCRFRHWVERLFARVGEMPDQGP
ncbi:hypothetical protein BKM31_55535 [[Actinomadura] parvosata subsp. kistnae]|uniref:Uncharacterized protein n=1 Tax=[Actinomadura] parvosata subsp. kistnae TaxID=1909395 RepID=A0A1V0AGZ5_9ACTN|nr:hypothetical protein BKM31_55535 [Nonomuraea sp. ATCC 55076]